MRIILIICSYMLIHHPLLIAEEGDPIQQELSVWTDSYANRVKQGLEAAFPTDFRDWPRYKHILKQVDIISQRMFPRRVFKDKQPVRIVVKQPLDQDQLWSEGMERNISDLFQEEFISYRFVDVTCKQLECFLWLYGDVGEVEIMQGLVRKRIRSSDFSELNTEVKHIRPVSTARLMDNTEMVMCITLMFEELSQSAK